MRARNRWSLWARWVAANSLGELVGLGGTFAVGFGLFSGLSEARAVGLVALSSLVMAATGVIEGVIVGVAQWWAMHRDFSRHRGPSWVFATAIGAMVAWFVGSIPMAIASLSASDQQAATEPEGFVVSLLAAVLGLVAGLVLAFPQWRVLRRSVAKAWLWMPANSVAWAAGMPIVFAGVDLAQKTGTVAGAVAAMAGILALTGAVVGAIHGAVLVFLAGRT